MSDTTTEAASAQATGGTPIAPLEPSTTLTAGTNPGTAADLGAAAASITAAAVSIPVDAHAEAQGIFASLKSKLDNFEHALAVDAKAELEKIKTLLHL